MVAEEHASFVYPEIKFNHFPITAGAILSRRLAADAARQPILQSDETNTNGPHD